MQKFSSDTIITEETLEQKQKTRWDIGSIYRMQIQLLN